MKKRFSFLIFLTLLAGAAEAREPDRLRAEIVQAFPHDAAAFTQGLFFKDGDLFETTGLVGRSDLRRVKLASGVVEKSAAMPADVFGEGSAPVGETIVALTWRSQRGFVIDAKTFRTLREFSYDGEGWGLASDGVRLVMSDGTPTLRFLDPRTLKETDRIAVTLRGEPLGRINELEFINGALYANVWQTDFIVRIDPANGVVDGIVDLTTLRDALGPEAFAAETLNGIAWDKARDRIFVTGKLWPKLFEVKFVPEE